MTYCYHDGTTDDHGDHPMRREIHLSWNRGSVLILLSDICDCDSDFGDCDCDPSPALLNMRIQYKYGHGYPRAIS